MNYDIIEALSQIAREKGVDLQVLKDRVEASLLSAARKKHGANAQITVRFDEGRGGIEMFMTKTVVGKVSDRGLEITSPQARAYKSDASVGDDVIIPLDVEEFGRNAILAAKQVLIQGVREAERERVYTNFADRVGSIVRGVVQQVDRGSIVVKLDTAEAIIPSREVMHRDLFRQREMVRGLVIKVDKEARGPQIILSRTHPDFLVKLFKAEVPEIAEGVVEIKAVAREAGHRSKIAVMSHDSRIDAVGACVGIKGSRVQTIVKELGGERIDIVFWASDPVVFVSRALSPARVLSAKVDEDNHQVTVMVPDDQLSLAIGKQGQNVRLAAKLTGWKIELHSQSEFEARSAAAAADAPLRNLDGASEPAIAALATAGITTASQVERLGLEELSRVNGVPEAMAERIYGLALAALATARSAAAQAATQRKAAATKAEEASEMSAEDDTVEDVTAEDPTAEESDEAESSDATDDETASEEPDFAAEARNMSNAGATGDEAVSGGMS
ncbi:MAG TPA: transcription termination factor NusA [Candidatus Eisenbacteria bacterium]|nr:transcription termination factor NusA [Candidatus Eisenbacteria bacterium]